MAFFLFSFLFFFFLLVFFDAFVLWSYPSITIYSTSLI